MKKEAITHGVLEDLANRNDNWDKLDGVPEKVDLLMQANESQWQAVSDEMTNKDVISAPEIIAARNGAANLKTRIDKDIQEITERLDSGVLGDIINETLFNSKLDKVEFNSYKELQNEINYNLEGETSILEYGADPTGLLDSTQAFKTAIKDCVYINIPKGNYIISETLTISESDKCQVINGLNKTHVILKFNGTDGISVEKTYVLIKNLTIKGGQGIGSGVKFNGANFLTLKEVNAINFDIGFDVRNNELFVVSGLIDRCRASYNESYGCYISPFEEHQKNSFVIQNSYFNKNGGPNMDNLDYPALEDKGDGVKIDGGYGILLSGNVFEYNSGCGLRILNDTYNINGITVIGNYFERNKYANMYVKNGTTKQFKNVVELSSYFTDAGLTPVSNAIEEREIHIVNLYKVLSGFDKGCSFSNISYAQHKVNMLSIKSTNLFLDYNDLSIFKKTTDMIENIEGVDYIVFRSWNVNFGEYFSRAMVKANKIYQFSFKYKNYSGIATSPISIVLYDDATLYRTNSQVTGAQSNEFKEFKIEFTPEKDMSLRVYLNIEGSRPLNTMVMLSDIEIKEI